MHVAVIGAGIVGLATARRLIDAGARVTLLDAESAPALGASARNGAQLSYAYVAPLAQPSVIMQLPGMLLDPTSALRLKPDLSREFWEWSLRFLAACRHSRSEASTAILLQLAALSRAGFDAWLTSIDAARVDHARNGKLVVFRTAAGFAEAQAQMRFQAALGCHQQALDAPACVAAEPALAHTAPDLVGGILTPDEEVADCAKVCAELYAQLSVHPAFEAWFGARVMNWSLAGAQARALAIETADGPKAITADAFVLTTGAGTNALLRPLGAHVALAPLKGYSIEVPADALAAMPALSITDSKRKIVFAPLGAGSTRRLRVAGMAELVGHNRSIDPARIDQLRDAVDAVFGLPRPPLDLQPWAGLRPVTPTALPCIGRLARWQNIFVNSGQGALGFTLAFGSAAVIADAVTMRRAHAQSRPFAVGPLVQA